MSRHDLGRDEFVKRVWEWKNTYGGKITNQIRSLGASVDWSRYEYTSIYPYILGLTLDCMNSLDDSLLNTYLSVSKSRYLLYTFICVFLFIYVSV